MQEPYDDEHEKPNLTQLAGQKEGQRWLTPYVDRVRTTLSTFLKLPADRQRFIIHARQDGYWWRGEREDVMHNGQKVWLYMLVIEQYEKQREMGSEAYREWAVKNMTKQASRIGAA